MSKRTSVYIHSFRHTNPIPNAARIGNMLISGFIVGREPETGAVLPSLERQLENMFRYMQETVEEGGGTLDDILKVNVWLRDHDNRTLLNQYWTTTFPDEARRPARQTIPLVTKSDVLVQCDIIAILDD